MVAGSRPSKALGALRAATGAVHERMHQAPAFAAIADEKLGMAGYVQLFERIAAFHMAVGQGLGLDKHRRTLLLRDLKALGSPVPARVPWTSPASGAARLGWVYVAEGSALGGKVIYRQLDYLFGSSPDGRRFFRGSGSDGQRWRSLCQQLELEGHERDGLAEMTCAAQQPFALFEELVVRPYG